MRPKGLQVMTNENPHVGKLDPQVGPLASPWWGSSWCSTVGAVLPLFYPPSLDYALRAGGFPPTNVVQPEELQGQKRTLRILKGTDKIMAQTAMNVSGFEYMQA